MADDTTEAMRRAREARLRDGRTGTAAQGAGPVPPQQKRPPSPPPAASPPPPARPTVPARPAAASTPARQPLAPRSRAGLGPWAGVGQAGALVLVLWQVLVLTGWQLPFRKSAELAVNWRYPRELAVRQAGVENFYEIRDFVLFQGPGRDHPWLFPACAVLLLLLVRATRPPEGLQSLLGRTVSLYGLAAAFASGPVLLREWPLTALLLLLSGSFLYWIRVRE
ncbi:hypothetical protein [Streptomyces xanthophaeus]|uniref:Uncharacterized protein n=1 Tax=Streptomyces xanthophaeus TaxID=67385 RepID=A0A919LC41_9ACTN|nr:hypothetical protein [Streptomyces xanthophaeus]GHI85250.1 hypothetical protein Sxan_26140 [Streptomyces xanthophaeus]